MSASLGTRSTRLRTLTAVVRKPNSCFNWRWTATLNTRSTPNGILKWRPGSVVSLYFPSRRTTPTSSGSI
jgi:hypothetical protein